MCVPSLCPTPAFATFSTLPLRSLTALPPTCTPRPCTTPPYQRRRAPRAEMVHVSVPITVEAPSAHCHALFSDLSQMPAWSSTLDSVSRSSTDPTLSTWAFSWRGIRLSWKARDADKIPSERHVIRWNAISGLPHSGLVTFIPTDDTDVATVVTLSVDYDIAALLAIIARSAIVAAFVESAIRTDLQRFRAYALRAHRAKRRAAGSSTTQSPSQ